VNRSDRIGPGKCATKGCVNLALPGPRSRRCYHHTRDLDAWFDSVLPSEREFAREMLCVALEEHPVGRDLYRRAVAPPPGVALHIGPEWYWVLQTAFSGIVGNAAWDAIKAATRVVWRRWRGRKRMPGGHLTGRLYERLRVAVNGSRPPKGRLTASLRQRVHALGRILLQPDHEEGRRE